MIEYIVRILHEGAPRAGFVARIDDVRAACELARTYEASARSVGLDWVYLVEARPGEPSASPWHPDGPDDAAARERELREQCGLTVRDLGYRPQLPSPFGGLRWRAA